MNDWNTPVFRQAGALPIQKRESNGHEFARHTVAVVTGRSAGIGFEAAKLFVDFLSRCCGSSNADWSLSAERVVQNRNDGFGECA
jgi:hypothetical protein